MTAATLPQPPPIKSLQLDYNAVNVEEISHGEEACTSRDRALLEGPYSRPLGDTEQNWCRAVGSGTGITVLSVLFSRVVDSSDLQRAIESLQLRHPRLRSHLVWVNGRPAFEVLDDSFAQVEVIDTSAFPPPPGSGQKEEKEQELAGKEERRNSENASSSERGNVCADGEGWSTAELQDVESHQWMSYIETELNTNTWPELQHSLDPLPMFVARFFLLPENRSLLVVRVHSAVCDRVSAGVVLLDVLNALREKEKNNTAQEDSAMSKMDEKSSKQLDCSNSNNCKPSSNCSSDSMSGKTTVNLMAVEEGIPSGQAKKPFWAHGIDLLGYSLGSRRHALLPFDETNVPRRSKIFHCVLNVQQTKLLLEGCESRDSTVYGAVCAAGLKAAAAVKLLGTRSEHFAVVTLIDCRRFLEPELSESTVGFYNSALMNTHHVNERTKFWDLARRCCGSLEDAMRNRKHFTDIGDINFLMAQAIRHPGLTPSSSMRTSLLVAFRDLIVHDMQKLLESLGVEHSMGCSSVHGVGPSLAIFDCIRNGELHFTGVYPTPLYSRSQMLTYMRLLVDILVQSVVEA